MLVKLNDLITKVKEAYETYDFAAVYHAIHNFCTIDLSSFYLDFAKTFYTLKVRTMKIVVQSKQYYMMFLLH